jgi:DNA polymerase I
VLVTYNGDEFDWPYLLERARLHRLRLDVGRDGSEPSTRQAGLHKVVSIAGRANIDLLRIAQRDLGDVKVKTLKNVADFLGVVEVQDRVMVQKDRIHALWDDPATRPTLVAYARDDARSTLDLARKLLPLQAELARMTRMPLDEESKMGRGRQVDWFLLAESFERGMIAPNKAHVREEVYEGGLVLEPVQGLHEDIVALDFSSMYPSIMVSYNVSPETYMPPEAGNAFRDDEVWVAPEVGHRFLRQPQGFFPTIMDELVERRRAWKRQLKASKAGTPEHTMADVKQQVLKILTNAFYGYTGWAGAKWYKRECAEATSAWGRHLVKQVIEDAKQRGLEVLYGDTDSLFVRSHPQIAEFVAEVNAKLPLELDVQARFDVIFFTGAKKRYAGLTKEGKVVVRGLEVRRGDWCELAKQLQEDVLEAVLRRRDPQGALGLARAAAQRVRDGKAGLAELTIHKTLTMDPDEYKAKQAHVHAVEAAKASHPDYEATPGTKIGYVVLRAKGRLKDKLPTERAVLVDFLPSDAELDLDYYVDKQLVPAALRVLEYFGVSEGDVKGAPKQQSLKDWF